MLERTGPDAVRAEIKVKMGAMSMKFTGTVEVIEKDAAEHRAVIQVESREAGGQGHANADVTFALSDGGGTIHTAAQITGPHPLRPLPHRERVRRRARRDESPEALAGLLLPQNAP